MAKIKVSMEDAEVHFFTDDNGDTHIQSNVVNLTLDIIGSVTMEEVQKVITRTLLEKVIEKCAAQKLKGNPAWETTQWAIEQLHDIVYPDAGEGEES